MRKLIQKLQKGKTVNIGFDDFGDLQFYSYEYDNPRQLHYPELRKNTYISYPTLSKNFFYPNKINPSREYVDYVEQNPLPKDASMYSSIIRNYRDELVKRAINKPVDTANKVLDKVGTIKSNRKKRDQYVYKNSGVYMAPEQSKYNQNFLDSTRPVKFSALSRLINEGMTSIQLGQRATNTKSKQSVTQQPAKQFSEQSKQTGQTKKGSTTQNSNQVVPKTYEDMYNNLNVKQLEYLDSFGISPFLMPSIFKNALNNKFNLSLKEDNNWSDEDQKALDQILAKSALEPAKIESEIKEPEPVKVESGISGVPTNFTRADIRAILSHYGINPYSLSGSQRKSLRKFFGGDSSQDISFVDKNSKLYKEWITPFTVYKKKQGGVVSRNVIYRFKNRLK